MTTYHFEYGTTAGYGLTTPENTASEGTDPVAVKAPIASLTRNTTYHYRLVATNAERAISRGADRTFHTEPRAAGADRDVDNVARRHLAHRAADHARGPQRPADHRALRVRAHDELRLVQRPRRRRLGHDQRAGRAPARRACGRTPATTSAPSRPTKPGSTRSLDRSFRTPREPTGISIALNPSRVVWGQDLTVVGRINGTAVGGIRVALERQGFPFQTGFTEVATKTASSKGTFSFNIASLFETTHFRIVTRTRTPITSGIRTASSAVRVGIRSRKRRPPQVAHHRRDLAERARPGASRSRSARRAGAGRSSSARRPSRSTRTARATVHGAQAEAQAAGRALPRRRAGARRRQARPRPQPRGPRGAAAQALNTRTR